MQTRKIKPIIATILKDSTDFPCTVISILKTEDNHVDKAIVQFALSDEHENVHLQGLYMIEGDDYVKYKRTNLDFAFSVLCNKAFSKKLTLVK